MVSEKSVIVVGGGLGGLTAAYRLTQAGYSVTVLESQSYVGGRTRSVNVAGCTIDMAATVIPSSYHSTLALISELGIEDQLEVVRGGFVVPRDGKQYYFSLDKPFLSFVKTSLLGWRSKLSMAKLLLKLLPMRKVFNFHNLSLAKGLDDETLYEYCKREFPSEVYEYFLNPMLKFLYLHTGTKGSSLELFWWMNAMGVGPSRSFKTGMNVLTQTLSNQVEVQCLSMATKVVEVGEKVEVTYSSEQSEKTLCADFCVIATPANVSAKIYPQVESQQKFLDSRRYDPVTVVSLVTSKRPVGDVIMIEIPDSLNVDLGTVIYQHNIASTRAPEGKGIVNAYFLKDWSEKYLDENEETVVNAVQDTLREMIPEVDCLEGFVVQRWPYTAAMTEVGGCEQLKQYLSAVDASSRVKVIGDFLVGASLNVAVSTGERVARQIIDD